MQRAFRILALALLGSGLVVSSAFAEECVLGEAAMVHKTRSLKSRKRELPSGTLITIVKRGRKWTKVKIGKHSAQMRTKTLESACSAPPPAEKGMLELESTKAALPAAPAPEAPSAIPTAAPSPPPSPRPTPSAPSSEQAFGDTYRIKVAVMQLGASANIEAGLTDALTQIVPETLEGLGVFKAISTQEIKQMLAFESQKQLLGCDEVSCLAEIGGALGADFLVTGQISLVGDAYILQLQLANIAMAKIEARVSREYSGDTKGVFGELRTATRLLVRNLLGEKSGLLSVRTSEEGATIKLDNAIVGVSPLLEPLSVAGGLHELAVEKEGYVVYREDVNIIEGKTLELNAQLIPSPAFIARYKSDASFTRTLAWVGLGVGAAAIAGGVALYFVGSGQAVDLRDDIRQFNALSVRSNADLADLDRREEQLAVLDTLTLTTAILGLAAATTGTILLVTGDDPGRYDTAGGGVSASLSPGPGGLALNGTF